METCNPLASLEVRMMPIEALKPAPYNPRRRLRPSDPAYRKLKASLRTFGLVEPLIFNERSGYVVGGHIRLRILKALGVKEVAVSVVQLSEEHEKALNIVLNNQEAQGSFDPAKLAELLQSFPDPDHLKLTGFDADSISALRLERDEEQDEDDEETAAVTVTLEMDEETYERLAEKLDALIGEFDLTSHLKRQ